MRAAVQTRTRLVVATVIAFAIGSLIVLLVARATARKLAADRAADILADAVPSEAIVRCREGSPRMGWIESGVSFDFYDASGQPLNAGAPPFDPELAGKLTAGRRSVGTYVFRPPESRAVIRLREAGRCEYALARWHHDGRSVVPSLATVGAGTATVALVLALLVAAFVARPLLFRIGELRRAAVAVGTSPYRPAPEWPDEAGDISRALNAAHSRILEDTRQLADRGSSLEWVLAEVGHDVRTPLSSLQLALDEIAEALPDTSLPTLRRALNDVIYLRSLTSNLRLASAFRGGTFEAPRTGATVCLSEIAQRAVDRSAPFALRRGIDLGHAITTDLNVFGDETGCEQALTNLLENGIAHSAPGTRVAVTVTGDEEKVRVVIEDDGPGVVPEQLPRLGSRAFRDERARTRDGRGTGLGLAITRAVCERSGWTVRFEQAHPSGLRAIIEARRAPEPAPAEEAGARPS